MTTMSASWTSVLTYPDLGDLLPDAAALPLVVTGGPRYAYVQVASADGAASGLEVFASDGVRASIDAEDAFAEFATRTAFGWIGSGGFSWPAGCLKVSDLLRPSAQPMLYF